MSTLATLPDSELARLHEQFAPCNVELAGGAVVGVRDTVAGSLRDPVLVCLHGIGSGSASWLDCALAIAPHARLIAWDAPGYGESTPLPQARPTARDHARRLGALLQALAIDDYVLVGHSLGALTAAAHAADPAGHPPPKRLVLLSPARGYGAPEAAAQRERVRTQRLAALDALGIEGMARERAGNLLSAHADARARAWVHWNMARLHEGGYRQAVELLCGTDLTAFAPSPMPVQVACGALDAVTPPEACAGVAQAFGVELSLLPDAGHACYVEQPQAAARLLREALAAASH